MSIYEAGFNPRPEDEREQEAWNDPPDEAADEWRGGEPVNQGDDWKDAGWPEDDAGPEYWLYKNGPDEE